MLAIFVIVLYNTAMTNRCEYGTMYQFMRLSDNSDDDAIDEVDALERSYNESDFAEQYLSKYSDIKTSTRDDW